MADPIVFPLDDGLIGECDEDGIVVLDAERKVKCELRWNHETQKHDYVAGDGRVVPAPASKVMSVSVEWTRHSDGAKGVIVVDATSTADAVVAAMGIYQENRSQTGFPDGITFRALDPVIGRIAVSVPG